MQGFALFAGIAVNDTSSVTAAASTWDSIHNTGSAVLDAATIAWLFLLGCNYCGKHSKAHFLGIW